uniref:Uncharacterized protein n=1 Tax=Arundo donax TaxID=35708 RepID=A0A0A8ZSA4_ARUDO
MLHYSVYSMDLFIKKEHQC